MNGYGLCSGGLQVRSDLGWTEVCGDGLNAEARAVACRELGCGVPHPARHQTGDEELVSALKFQCRGNESRLEDCVSSSHTCKAPLELSCSSTVLSGLHST